MIEVRSAGVLIKKDKILLAKHVKDNQSYWVLPGGRVEFGENLARALEREILEETGLKVKAGQFLFFHEIILKHRHILNFYFKLSQKGGRLVKIVEEVFKGAEFIPVKDLKNLQFQPKMLLNRFIKCHKNKFKNCPQFLV